MRALPPYEQATIDLDLPVLEAWASRHPDLVAAVVVDRAAFDSNVGHVLLVVELHESDAVRRTQAELVPLVTRPEHLRVRRLIPEPVDLEPLSDEVWALDGSPTRISTTWPDPSTGTLHVALDRIDPAFKARIEALAPDRIHVLPDPQDVAVPLASRPLPPYEQATIDLDLPVVQAWAAERGELVAEVNVDREAFESNLGHVVLVIEVRDHTAVGPTQAEVSALLHRPEHLRVRVWAPDPAELELLSRQVWDLQSTTNSQIASTGPDPVTGLLQVALDRHDPEFAARLEAIHPGWIQVLPEPEEMPVPLVPLGRLS